MAKAKKSVNARQTVNHNECGLRLDNINPVLPPDNEHTNAGTVALCTSISQIANAIIETAKALQEAARSNQKAGVHIRDSHFGIDRT